MRTLASFQNVHRSEALVVCGCGESLNALAGPERFVTIGVNDVGRLFTPRYLVVVNPRNQFAGDRASSIVRCTGREETSRLLDGEHTYAQMSRPTFVYGDGRAARRIVDALLSYA
jgi:hypothetical protein